MGNKKLDSLQSFDSLTAPSKELKISRQTLYERLKINNLKGWLSFTKEGLSLLKKRPNKSVKVDSQVDTSKRDTVSVLREELRAKNHTINQLNEQLINNQKLQLMSQPISEQLTNELHELKKLNHQNKVFGQRIFGKK